MLEKNGVLANGVLAEILNHMTQDLVVNSGRNLIIEQMLIYFLQAVQIDDTFADSGSDYSSHETLSYYRLRHLSWASDCFKKANITVKIN